jgi:HEAT repeat protein
LTDADSTVQDCAAFALGRQSEITSDQVDAVTKLVRDPRVPIRVSAIRAVNYLRRRTAEQIQLLVAALKDPDRSVRDEAAEAVRQAAIADSSWLDGLHDLQKDPSSDVRASVARALPGTEGGIRSSEFRSLLDDSDGAVRAEAYRGIAIQDTTSRFGSIRQTLFGTPAMQQLLAALKDKDRRVREASAEAIERAADALTAPLPKAPAPRGGRQGFRGPAMPRPAGPVPPQMDAAVRDDIQAALNILLTMPEGTMEASGRVEVTPERLRNALAMFKTLR